LQNPDTLLQAIAWLLGDLALFIHGIDLMSRGFRLAAGDRLRRFLATATKTPLQGMVLGFVITAIVQSSSATTVMVVGG